MAGVFESARFARVWESLGGGGDPVALFERLAAAYGQSHRAYHTRAHIAQVLVALDGAAALAEDQPVVELALWFHDAACDPQVRDNEERSAQWLESESTSGGLDPARFARAAAHVRATAHGCSAETADPDTHLALDCDLSILGADPDTFDAYDRAIRSEYAWVPPEVYAVERGRVLRAFLGADGIYRTAAFAALEVPARANIERVLARLEA